MKDFTNAKEFRNIIRISDCCQAKVYPDSDICTDPNCGEHSTVLESCDECYGKGLVDVIDDSKSMELRINPPLKTVQCEKCQGQGFVEVWE